MKCHKQSENHLYIQVNKQNYCHSPRCFCNLGEMALKEEEEVEEEEEEEKEGEVCGSNVKKKMSKCFEFRVFGLSDGHKQKELTQGDRLN